MALTLCGLATATPQGLPQELQPLWDSMTLEEKVGQMIMVYMSPPDFVIENNLGGVLVMGAHLSTRNQLQKNLKNIASRAKIPLLVTIDQEGGHVNRIRSLDRKWEKAPSAGIIVSSIASIEYSTPKSTVVDVPPTKSRPKFSAPSPFT